LKQLKESTMNSITPGLIPPRPGLEKEEPELTHEDDIPRDDRPQAADEPALEPHDESE
jgi:hypothetical protein